MKDNTYKIFESEKRKILVKKKYNKNKKKFDIQIESKEKLKAITLRTTFSYEKEEIADKAFEELDQNNIEKLFKVVLGI